MSIRNFLACKPNKCAPQIALFSAAVFVSLSTVIFVIAGGNMAQSARASGQYHQGPYQQPVNIDTATDTTIIGGKESEKDAWPWVVALLKADIDNNFWSQYCAGTLIAPDWVMTAAHCTYMSGGEAENDQIQVLITTGSLGAQNSNRVDIKQIIRYPTFRRPGNDNDIALIQLEQSIDQPTAHIVEHDDPATELPGRNATVIGWGKAENAFRSDQLREVEVPLVSPIECLNAYAKLHYTITNNMLCAGYSQGGKDACTGDSGGPLVVSKENSDGEVSWTVIGIVSWGKGCAQPEAYGVYTRVSKYSFWIQYHVGLSKSSPTATIAPTTTLLPPSGIPQLAQKIYAPLNTFP